MQATGGVRGGVLFSFIVWKSGKSGVLLRGKAEVRNLPEPDSYSVRGGALGKLVGAGQGEGAAGADG